jgi:hypothetical protein
MDVMLTIFGMKEHSADDNGANDDEHDDGLGIMNQVSFTPRPLVRRVTANLSHSKTSQSRSAGKPQATLEAV